MNDFLINGGIPVTLYSNMLTFRGCKKSFEIDGNLFETMTNYDFNVNHAKPQDQKLIYEFGKEMKFHIKQKRRKINRDKLLINLLKAPAILASDVSSSRKKKSFSKTKFLLSDPDELCDRLKLLLQEKQGGKNSDLYNRKIVAIIDKLGEYKWITKKQQNQL